MMLQAVTAQTSACVTQNDRITVNFCLSKIKIILSKTPNWDSCFSYLVKVVNCENE